MAVHESIDGLQCSAEQCSLVFRRLTDVKEHINQEIKEFDPAEIDWCQIYESLDSNIDQDDLGKEKTEGKLKKRRGGGHGY